MLNLVILGGGKGKRLKKYFTGSKILLKVFNKSLLELNFNIFKKINKKYLIINKNQIDIIEYLKNKNISGLNILKEDKRLDTGGCLYYLKKIKNYKKKVFLIIYGDLLIDIDYQRFYKFFKKTNSKISLIVHPNDHIQDSDTLEVKDNGFVDKFFFKPHKNLNKISTLALSGVCLLKGSILSNIKKKKLKFKSILKKNKKYVSAYETREFIKDIGTPKRVEWARKFLLKRDISKKNFKNPIKTIFLDRDGVLNKEKKDEKVSDPFNFTKGALRSLKEINNRNYIIVIITNQPGVAKGFISEAKLKKLNKDYINFLSRKKIIIHSLFYCPHHPEKGFKGEIKKYKIKCDCRKPRVGLFKKAIKKYNIDLRNSIFIGNSKTDYEASKKIKVNYLHIFGNSKVSYIDKKFQYSSFNNAIKSYFKN